MKSIARKLSLRKDKDEKKESTSPASHATTSTRVSSTAQQTIPESSSPRPQPATDTKTMAPSELPKTYKAAVITGQQKPLEIQDLPMPEVTDGLILLKVLACGRLSQRPSCS